MAEAYPVAITIPVQWSEMDALGHVNNARFFTWFESARIATFRAVGLVGGPVGPVLKTTSCDFLSPVVFPASVAVGARVASVGKTSLVMEYVVVADGKKVATGSSVVVLVDYATMAKVAVSDELRARWMPRG